MSLPKPSTPLLQQDPSFQPAQGEEYSAGAHRQSQRSAAGNGAYKTATFGAVTETRLKPRADWISAPRSQNSRDRRIRPKSGEPLAHAVFRRWS
jgi:hypothetical protein